jgi:hypothetical protein
MVLDVLGGEKDTNYWAGSKGQGLGQRAGRGARDKDFSFQWSYFMR